jgi:hypothetical protein
MDATKHIPTEYLFQISEQAPRSLSAYIMLCHIADNDGRVEVDREWVENTKNLSWTKFKNDLRALARLGLIEWVVSKQSVIVHIADLHELAG